MSEAIKMEPLTIETWFIPQMKGNLYVNPKNEV